MQRVWENGSFLRLLDELEELGMMGKLDDINQQIGDQLYEAKAGDTIHTSFETEHFVYQFYFNVIDYEDRPEGYSDMEEEPIMIVYMHHTKLDK
ncbi:hypothetical protein HNR44_001741 [Geomicrobium halophilum]|uniref:Uncharacterized protein n=1 Tax=Geomicrobium halophilum TaxID=549000 RepID=A0A841PYK6_9BACL|nr:hypothetical protein [Geomicrobium halophilum]MBB6449763.1 hypothetical protein [Geomicrobium halophilum]